MGLSSKGQPNGVAKLNASGRLPAAQASQGVAVADQAALTAAAAASTPTKTEFDKVVADAVVARTTLNALLASLRTAGILAP